MRRMLMVSGLAMIVAASGCEWSSSGSGSTWNDAYNWLNFSGTYRAPDGGAVVRGIASNPGGTTTVRNEPHGVTVAGRDSYGLVLNYVPAVATTVSVRIGGLLWRDDGQGNMVGEVGGGSVIYGTGDISIYGAQSAPIGSPITASYEFQASGEGGTSGDPIVSLTVEQRGNAISITDNEGRRFDGTVTSVQVPGGDSTGASDGQATINFECSGNGVRIVGTINGGYVTNSSGGGDNDGILSGGGGAGDGTGSLMDRLMQGSWLEPDIKGDILGVAYGTVVLEPMTPVDPGAGQGVPAP